MKVRYTYGRNVSPKDMIGLKVSKAKPLHADSAMKFKIRKNEPEKKKKIFHLYPCLSSKEKYNGIYFCSNVHSIFYYSVIFEGDKDVVCNKCSLYKTEKSIFVTNKKSNDNRKKIHRD